jgi:pyruvate formate lyase activating enzyme
MCVWIRDNLGKDVPLHFSRFIPQYLLTNLPPTPVETLRNARDIAKEEGLNFVYIGNVIGEGEDTYCPYDGRRIIKRVGYSIEEYNLLKGGKCKFCGNTIAGRWF